MAKKDRKIIKEKNTSGLIKNKNTHIEIEIRISSIKFIYVSQHFLKVVVSEVISRINADDVDLVIFK